MTIEKYRELMLPLDLAKVEQNFPAAMRQRPQWVLFRLAQRDGHVTKPPYQPSGQPAESNNPNTWHTYAEVIAAFNRKLAEFDGIGFMIADPWVGVDFDKVIHGEPQVNAVPGLNTVETSFGHVEQWALDAIKQLNSYTELSPSRTGFHVWCTGNLPDSARKRKGRVEIYQVGRYFTVTGEILPGCTAVVNDLPKDFPAMVETLDPAITVKDVDARATSAKPNQFELLMEGKIVEAGFKDPTGDSDADFRLCCLLAQKFNGNRELMDKIFRSSGLLRDKWDERHGSDTYGNLTITKAIGAKSATASGEDWRDFCSSFPQLTTELPKFLIGGLIPEEALTFITGPSFHGKTWLALAIAKAVSSGESLWCFDGPEEPVPVFYHVPEMNEALVRQRMVSLGLGDAADPEMFIVRTMKDGVWALDEPRMLKSSQGRVVFFDTQGFFNPADDASDYKASLHFGQLVFNLLNQGARAVVALAHPPKYATKPKDEPEWTLENSVLGSAGYGGILRSCLRVKNLNPDTNDPNIQVYVQGLKNPGLKPFQLEGTPLRMKLPPGECPYLSTLQAETREETDPRKAKARVLWGKKAGRNKIADQLKVNKDTVSDWIKEWEAEFEEQNPALVPAVEKFENDSQKERAA